MRFLVSILFLALPAVAGIVTGTVRDPDGRVVAGATVRIQVGMETEPGRRISLGEGPNRRAKARAEFEEVGRKPLGDGFTGVPLTELRGALVRPFAVFPLRCYAAFLSFS